MTEVRMNTKKFVVIVMVVVAGFLAGCAKPTPPTLSSDIEVMQRLQGKWEYYFNSKKDLLTITIDGQNINIHSAAYAKQVKSMTKMNNGMLKNQYDGYHTTYNISNGIASFVGRTGITMNIWPKEDGRLVVVYMTHPDKQYFFNRVVGGEKVASN